MRSETSSRDPICVLTSTIKKNLGRSQLIGTVYVEDGDIVIVLPFTSDVVAREAIRQLRTEDLERPDVSFDPNQFSSAATRLELGEGVEMTGVIIEGGQA